MIKRAKRLALDLFKEIKDSYLPTNKKNKGKGGSNEEEDDDNPPCNNQQDKKLRNSTSEKNLSPKPKRSSSFSSKRKGSEASNSLPLPLNSDPSWQAHRERSTTDPASPSGNKSKVKPLRATSEALLKRTSSRDKLTRSNSKDKITRDALFRKKSMWKKKPDVESGSAKDTGVLEVLSVGSAPDSLAPLDANTFQVSFSVDNIDAYLAERLEGPIAHDMWQMKAGRGSSQAMEERAHKKDSKKESALASSKGVVGDEDAFSKHMLFCDKIMAQEIAAVCANLDEQRRELLEEILLREGPAPAQEIASPRKDIAAQETAAPLAGSQEFVALRKGKHARKGSAVAFNSTVEIVELGNDGSKLKTSTAELCEQPRPRPLSRKMRARMPSALTIPSDPPYPSSSSPASSPFSSPRLFATHTPSPPVSPIASPRDIHLTAPSALSSPSLSPILPSPRVPPSPRFPRFPPSPRFSPSPLASPRTSSPSSSPRLFSDSLPSPRELSPPSPSAQRHSTDSASSKAKAPLRAWARVFGGRAHKTQSDEVDPWVAARAMEEEISQVLTRCAQEKLELLEEIELREISEASARLDAERNELLAEIARREKQEEIEGEGIEGTQREGREETKREEIAGGEAPRSSPLQEKRHAMRLRRTLARRAAKGMDEATQKEEDEKMAKAIQEFSATNNGVRLGTDGTHANRPGKKLRRDLETSRNASLRAAARNAARKNLWIAEVPQAKVQ